ncbi:bifunctional [glutamate--ammonia ligase]-adenylyl-L-tyrosine phosphorylase/[glutamate--ammonia-ligase] adenylyltransferase [Herminiimonas sp. CN]|uniref:bifunctional [glutamate--ammonia ligase]-adenylyl-L-tyrosine phosphorylase/[glutamate--ammonia-ligase] adenylyltransferase n=1 Tax=Herminiimonas sp. CN TaxID=1349818 RepID=UPI0004742674|nr:bifunctional [glutamate--ammonia ligase]-adenylyl-L-tyrosine phosphorylase/[glutamate--ammonia-ligase] adenylyltransferase [Herminiimonas sp. CN]
MTTSLLSSAAASRFYARWQNAAQERPALVASIAQLPLNRSSFVRALQNETSAGLPLSRAMRRLRNLVIAILIERDLSGAADMNEVVGTISAFADFAVQTHLAALMAEMVALHGVPIGEDSGAEQELIVLGMGKLGGFELNVSSDIDLIFVYAEDGETRTSAAEQRQLSNHEFFVRLGKKLIHAIAEIEEDGFTFRVDMALRPNGKSGPLAASFNMVEEYFIVQGREWERYAWVKARALTGRPADIALLDSIIRPFVYRRYLDFGAIDAIRNMHSQIRAEVIRQETRHPERSNNVKLGRGGIREIEFIAQVFQLIRGGRDPALRDRSTRNVLRTLAEKGILSQQCVAQLLHANEFLRNLEHRLQYIEDAQTHTLPANPADQLTVANMMGMADVPSLLQALDAQRQLVAARFDAIFSEKDDTQDAAGAPAGSPPIDLQMFANLPDAEKAEAIETQLAAIGFDDAPTAAQRLLETGKSSRLQALPLDSRKRFLALINTALPFIAQAKKDQLATLSRLLDLLEAIARRSAYLSLLTEYPPALERVIRMMQASDWAAKYLTRHPILLDELLDQNAVRTAPAWANFSVELQQQLEAATLGGEPDTELQMNILRDMHHAQLFRLLVLDLEGNLSMEHLADHLSQLADIMVAATIRAVWKTIPKRHLETPKFAVIAYGKLGGKELGYASDLDVIFLYDDDDQEAPALYAKLAQRFITWMTSHTSSGILFDIDIALRPDGGSGLLVSSVASFERYQSESAWVWEHQALTRARFCAGDTGIGARFEAVRENVLRQIRAEAQLKQDILQMRTKLRAAHPNRSALFDLKHDAGGMIDIEFIVQFLVLQHAAEHPQLTANFGNIALLKTCGALGLIDPALAEAVASAYRDFRKMQHNIRLQGSDRARVEPEEVASRADAVKRLWEAVFGVVG